MKPFVISGALFVLCLAGLVSAQQRTTYGQPYYQPPPANRLDRKVDGHTQYNIGRSAEPPTAEAEKLFLTIVTSDSWQTNERERQFVGWFNSDPRLAKLRGNTRFNWYLASNPHFRDRLRYKYGEALPIINISRPDGEAVLHVTALSMPRTSGELADMADDAVNAKYAPPASSHSGGGGIPQTQIVEDCPNCPDDRAPPNADDGQQIAPISEVIPARTPVWLYVSLAVGGVVAVFGFIALLLLVLLWPRTGDSRLTF